VRRLALLVALAAGLALPSAAHAAPSLSKIGDFSSPIHVSGSPGDGHRLFVVERDGRVQLVVDGRRAATPFLDISGETLRDDSERGLLSIAFPPDYQTSGRFYVYLTARATASSPAGQIQIREYRRAPGDLDHADPASGRTILRIDHARGNHNGGQLQFGPDGKLWIGTGDGGGGDDPDRNGQDPATLLGKMLRIDPLAGGSPEIFALGLRNPWRFSFDRQTGDLTIGDVGQNDWEEIDHAPAPEWNGPGANYGWPCFEGLHDNSSPDPRCGSLSGDVKPVLERGPHGPEICSITGGYVVRDPGLPTLRGRYLYGDLCAPRLRSLLLSDPGSDGETNLSVANVTSFGEDVCGRLYVASLDGPVSRIEDGAATPCAVDPPPPGGGTGTPGGGTGTPGTADTAKPRLRVRVTGARTLVPRRRLRVAVTADELVSVRAGGRLRGVGGLEPARRQLRAGRRTVLTVRITRSTARKLRRTLHRKRVIAAMTVLARDAAGNQRRVTRRVRIARRR
jgi:glucose/sorbosone dehydrogenase